MIPRVELAACKEAFARWNTHNCGRLGAALAFYTLLSLAPLLLFVVAVVAFFFGRKEAQDWIVQEVSQLVGGQGASAIRYLMLQTHERASGAWAGTVGAITLLVGASGVFTELRDGLNTVWDAKTPGASTWKGMAKTHLFSLGMVLAIGFVLLVSLILSTALAAVMRYFSGIVPFPAPLLELVNFIASIYAIAGLFALIFKYVPQLKLDWKDVWRGALFTSVLFTAGKMLMGIYLGVASVGSAYGAAGSLVAVVVWVYYSAQIFYYGAEFTWVRGRERRQVSESPEAGGTLAKTARA